METQSVRLLAVHGTIVLLLGLISGIPYWYVIIRRKAEQSIRAWRVAHTTLALCGLIMLVVALMSPYLDLSAKLITIMVWLLVVSGYGFVFALIVGAATRRPALLPGEDVLNVLLFLGHLVGAVGAILGACLLLYGLL